MPAIDFPASPSVNDEYSFEGRTWLWNGTGWEVKSYPAALQLGSASAPSLYFTGDDNTGLYSPGADQVAITTAGIQKFTIDSLDGNAIIENSFPTTRPSLDLPFALTKTLDPRITFTRASTGTYVGSDGLIKSAAVNEARFDHAPSTGESLGLLVEEARTNSLTYSEEFSSGWTASEVTTIPDSALSPDGTFTALKLVPTTVNTANHSFAKSSANAASTWTMSVYAKAAGYNYVQLNMTAQPGGLFIVDLSNGTVAFTGASVSNVSVVSLANGWYRIAGTITTSTSRTFTIYPMDGGVWNTSFAGDGTSGVFLWGAQLEAGSFPTSYTPTPAAFTSRASTATYYDSAGVIQTAGIDIARSNAFFPDSNGVMRSAGLLLEAAGTNLLQQSESISTSPWSLENSASVSANSTVAPDGTTTADTLGGTLTSSYIQQTIPWTVSGDWSLSVFAKAGTSSQSRIYIVRSASQVHGTNIVWSGGVPTASSPFGCSVSIQALASGWYRITLRLTSVDHTATNFLRITSDNISGTGTVILWGVQAEQNAYPTSYIPTVASTVTRSADVSSSATVTRSADVASITGTNFSSWYNQSEGTAFFEYSNVPATSNPLMYGFTGATDDNRIIHYFRSSGTQLRFDTSANALLESVITITNTNPGTYKVAVGIEPQNIKATLNGAVPVADTGRTGNVPIVNQLLLSTTTVTSVYTGVRTISRLTYWPTRLSDATLQALTAS